MIRLSLIIIAILITSACTAQETDPNRQWTMFRGNNANGYLDNCHLPESWNLADNVNIAWKTEIPGTGHSSPVIWENKIFVNTAVSEEGRGEIKTGIYGSIGSVEEDAEYDWKLFCIDIKSGDIIWEQTAHRGIPEQKRHPMSSHANCTPATNGEYVVTFFGSEGLYCYDMKGNLQWKKDFGILRSAFFMVESAEWEFASSPLIHDDAVVVQCDVMENSFLAAFDIKTGKELWKKDRDEYPGWSTPVIYYDGQKACIAVNGYKHRGGYDFYSGEEIWKMSGGGDIPVPTPVVGDQVIYFNSAHGKMSPVLAIHKNARGSIPLDEKNPSGKFIKWAKARGGSYMGTMLLYNGLLYNLRWNGKMSCYDAATGEEFYAEKVGSGNSYTSSPVASDGIIYITDNDGVVYSVRAGKEFYLTGQNKLNETCTSTPAIAENYLFFRTEKHLIAIGKR